MAANQSKNSKADHLAPHQFKPGESGNPSGRPKGTVSLVALLRKKLSQVPDGQRKTFAEGIVDATVRDALKGDGAARKLVWEYIEGQAKQQVQLTGVDGGPVQHVDLSNLSKKQLHDLDALLGAASSDEGGCPI